MYSAILDKERLYPCILSFYNTRSSEWSLEMGRGSCCEVGLRKKMARINPIHTIATPPSTAARPVAAEEVDGAAFQAKAKDAVLKNVNDEIKPIVEGLFSN